MRKSILFLFFFAFALLALAGCNSESIENVVYTDDDAIEMAMQGDSLQILQLTDLHFTYGIDSNDRLTLDCIQTLVESRSWDLVVITGDMAMSITGPSLFGKLVNFMESLETPWTFVFGNHETDYASYQSYLEKTEDTTYLRFKVGPEMVDGGIGNFRIVFTKDANPFYVLYFLDSHTERDNYTEEEGEYGYLSEAQVAWYEDHVQNDTVDSVMYMHIPLRQFMAAEESGADYDGLFLEDKVYPQGIDTGMFDAIVDAGKTKGVFVGHDHLNDFTIVVDGILLAYGQITGYNAYGDLPRGGRIVSVDASGVMTTSILLESEVSS